MFAEKIVCLKKWQKEYRKGINQKFLVLAVLCIGYLIFHLEWIIFFAITWSIYILYLIGKQNQKWNAYFQKEQENCNEKIRSWMQENGFEKAVSVYQVREGKMELAELFFTKEEAILLAPVIHAHRLYRIENKFWYLFSLDLGQDFRMERQKKENLFFLEKEDNHQQFLLKYSQESQNVSIMESFIYDRFFTCFHQNKLFYFVEMDDEIDHLRKESLWKLKWSDSDTLYITDMEAEYTGLKR